MRSHTDEFYLNKYMEVREYAVEIGVEFPYTNLDEFKSDWVDIQESGAKNVLKEIKYNIQYETKYKTALAEKRMLKEAGLSDIKLKDLKLMSTREFAAAHLDELEAAYDEYRKMGKSPLGAKLAVSRYWFGSE